MSGGQKCLGIRDSEFLGALVCGGEQAPDAPCNGVLRERAVGVLAELLERRLLVRSRSSPASRRCSGTSSPRMSKARCTRADAATAARAERRRLASSKLARRFAVPRTSRRVRFSSHSMHRVVGAEPREQVQRWRRRHESRRGRRRAPRGTSRDAEPARGADESQRGLGTGRRHLERRRSAGLRERAVGDERAAPGANGVVDARRRRPAAAAPHGTSAVIEQARLASERLALLDDADEVAVALLETTGDHDDVASRGCRRPG